MALPIAAIVSIVFGVWALLVLIIFAVYQVLKTRGTCSCDCAPCGKESNGQCSDCCISLSETCDCDCCKSSSGSCLDSVCPKKKISCVDIILCQCCAQPGDQPCCVSCKCDEDAEPCRCMGGPACKFRPCDCAGEGEEERPFSCRDICCCELNYRPPTWMPTATPSTAQVATPPAEFMQEMSRLSQSGFTFQLVGPGGSVRTLDTPFGAHSSHTVVSGRSTPVLSLHGSPVNSARGVGSSRRISLQVPERITRAQYDRTHHSDTRLFNNNARRTSSDTGSHSRVLPPIPDFPAEQHSVT